jgi:hypothetical protein
MLNAPTNGRLIAASMFLLAACSSGEQGSQEAASNPCAGANPCAAGANPCAAMNPCDAGLAAKISQGDRALYTGGRSSEELVAMGEQLWADKSLSSAGTTSCSTCHTGGTGMMEASFGEPYPHAVKMAKERAGLETVTAAEMVQLCMVIPMQNEPLDWNSVELAALTEYVTSLQSGFDPSMAGDMNPCAGKNACNPCAGGGD